MRRVLLINPPELARVPARICTPPLGLLYLAGALRTRGMAAMVLDAFAENLAIDDVRHVAKAVAPDIIGITAMTPTADAAYKVMAALRPLTDCLVLGGAHASALGAAAFADCPVPLEALVCGEAEDTFPEYASRYFAGEHPAKITIPGILRPGDRPQTNQWPRVRDLDALPLPDRALLPASRYRHPLLPGGPVVTMITSRGCPYRCIFCDKHVCGSAWRARSPRSVLAEIEDIVLRGGVTRIIIYDDLFTLDRKRVMAICRGIVERGLSIRWKCEGRVNRVDAEMLGWMRRAGCEMIAYGVESATEAGRAFLQKDITTEQVREAFALTRAAGIKTLGYYLLGIPGETMEDELQTARLAVETRADYAQFGVLSPFPGTRLYEYASERGWVREAPARGPAELGGRRAVIEDGYWTGERLGRMLRRAHRIFYLRPSYVYSRLKSVQSAAELTEGAGQAVRLALWGLRSAGAKDKDMADGHSGLRVCYFGTYSRGEEYARNNAIMAGLEANGALVLPCQVDVWPTHEEKMGAMNKGLLGQGLPFAKAYFKLLRQYRAMPGHDFVFVGYIGHIDMFPAWVLARLSRKPIVFDAFYSLYDTVVLDRGLYDQASARARLLHWIDRWSCRLADMVLLDTWEHVDYFCREFGLDRARFHAVPLGTDEANFYPRPGPPDDGVFDLISYSSYIPLHGLEYQIDAAALLAEHEDIRFTFVGKGQLYPDIRARAERLRLTNVEFIEWVSHAELVEKIAAADACLGIFGLTEKASRVVPYKAYEALAMQKPLLTGDSPAARDLLTDGVHASLSPMGDARALAERILKLRGDPTLRQTMAENGHRLFLERGTSRAMARSILEAMSRRWPGRVQGG